jgi:allophanate hydrolase subunit 2
MNKMRAKTALARCATAAACAHHWVIDSPAGPTSRGFCTLCGAENDFPNYAQFPPGQNIRFKARGRRSAESLH